MFERFNTSRKEYRIRPSGLVELLQELTQEMGKESENRRCSETNLKPEFWLYINYLHDRNAYDPSADLKMEDFYGARIDIKTTKVNGPEITDCAGINMGSISVSPKGRSVAMNILGIEGVAVNPEIVYEIAKKYCK